MPYAYIPGYMSNACIQKPQRMLSLNPKIWVFTNFANSVSCCLFFFFFFFLLYLSVTVSLRVPTQLPHKRRANSLLNHMYAQSINEIDTVHETCDRILRSTKKVKMKYKFSRLTKLHNSPYYRGVKLWNKLPANIQSCKVKLEFKKRIWTK